MLPPLFSCVGPDVALFDSPPICDCAAANPPNPTTAATATVANNLFLISALLCSPVKPSRGFSDHEMPLLDSCHVLTGSTRLRASMFRQVPQRSARSFRNPSRNSAHVGHVSCARQFFGDSRWTGTGSKGTGKK